MADGIGFSSYDPQKDYTTAETYNITQGIPFTNPDTGEVTPPLDDSVANTRALKADFGMGPNSMGKPEILHRIGTGQEDSAREAAAAAQDEVDWKKRRKVTEMLYQDRASRGEPVTKQDLEAIGQLNNVEYRNDPKTIFERNFAKRVVDDVATNPNLVAQATKEDTKKADDAINFGGDFIANQEIARKIKEDLDAEIAASGYVARSLDFIGNAVLPVSWWVTRNALKERPASGGILKGTNLAEQIDDYYRMKPEVAQRALKTTVDEIKKISPEMASNYVAAFNHYSSSSQIWDNIMGPVEVATLPGAGAAIKYGPQLVSAIRDTAVALSAARPTVSQVVAAGGDTLKAAQIDIMESMNRVAARSGGNSLEGVEQIKRTLPNWANPEQLIEGGNSFGRTTHDALLATSTQRRKNLTDAISDPALQVSRIEFGTPEADAAMADTILNIRRNYPGMSNSIIDSTWEHNILANTDHVVSKIGDTSGRFFTDQESASLMATYYGIRNPVIKQQGSGYYIELNKAIQETSDAVYEASIPLAHQTPENVVNALIGTLRKSNAKVGEDIAREAAVAQYGSGTMREAIKKAAEPIANLTRRERQGFTDFLSWERDLPHPTIPNHRGQFSRTLGELENKWYGRFNRNPTPKEIEAYFAYTDISDADWIARTIRVNSRDTRAGLEMHDMPLKGYDRDNMNIKGRIISNEEFLNATSPNSEPAGILVWDQDPAIMGRQYAESQYLTSEAGQARNEAVQIGINTQSLQAAAGQGTRVATPPRVQPYTRQELTNMVNSGEYRIIRLAPESNEVVHSLPGVATHLNRDDHINYILSRDVNAKPIPFNQLPYRPGGHQEYYRGSFIGQARVTGNERFGHTYRGDTNIFHMSRHEDGVRAAADWEGARVLARDNRMEELANYVRSRLPVSPNEFNKMVEDGIIDLNLPIRVRKNGQTFGDAYNLKQEYTKLLDERNSIHNPYRGAETVPYSGEKNAPVLTYDPGALRGPNLPFRPAERLDPVSTLNRASSNIMADKYTGDLKVKYADRFSKEFGHLLDIPTNELRANPIKALFDGNFRKRDLKNMTITERTELAAAKNFRRTALQFWGVKNPAETAIESTLRNLSDNLRESHHLQWVPWAQLDRLPSPIRVLRQFAFHEKLGAFNPVQLPLQASQAANVIAIEGVKNGLRGVGAYSFQRAASMAPSKLDGIAQQTAKIGWNPEHFKECTLALERIQFHAPKYNYIEADYTTGSMFQFKGEKFLDHGLFFFNEGERIARSTSWNSAYLRWREANPTAVFNEAAQKQVLQRAELTNFHMNSQSAAGWQKGILSVPTQFFAYQARVTEAMLGHELTVWEKTRLVGANAFMYGVPTAGGLYLGATPFSDSLKKGADLAGIKMDDGAAQNIALNGVPAVLGKFVFGEQYNFGDRYGMNGIDIIKDWRDGKKGLMDFIGGASVNIFNQNVQAMNKFASTVIKSFKPEQEGGYKLHPQDYIDVLNHISSFRNINKAEVIFNLGRYYTANQALQKEVTKGDFSRVIAQGVLGLTPKDIHDMQANYVYRPKDTSPEGLKKSEFFRVLNEAQRLYSVGFQSQLRGDNQAAENMFKRMRLWMIANGWNEDMIRKQSAKITENVNLDSFDKLAKRLQREENMKKRYQ